MRRVSSIIAVLAMLLLMSLALGPDALGQGEDAGLGEHPIIGSWIADVTPEDEAGPTDLVTFNPGGTLVSLAVEGVALGTWAPTGERSADITFNGPVIVPEAGFLGFVTIRGSVEVSEDGQSFTATYTQEVPAAMAQNFGIPEGELGPGDATAERIGIEQMGETKGPIPPLEEAPAP